VRRAGSIWICVEQRDRVDLAPERVGRRAVEAQRRASRACGTGLDVEDGERSARAAAPDGGLGAHPTRALARTRSKNSPTASSTPRPPVMPSQRDLISPTMR
jgi:hypothetical protein